MLPTWIQAGGLAPLRERLADRAESGAGSATSSARAAGCSPATGAWDEVRIGALTRPEHLAWEGRTLGDVMRDTGRDAVDAICDLLLAEDLRVNQVTPGPHREGIRPFLQHPVGDDRDRSAC